MYATLKAVVIGMGVLIVVGFAVVVIEITRRLANPWAKRRRSAAGEARTLAVPQGCTLAEIAGVGERLRAAAGTGGQAAPTSSISTRRDREVGGSTLQPPQ